MSALNENIHTEYEIYVGWMLWDSALTLEKAYEIYEEAKEFNSDCYICLAKVTKEYIESEFIEYDDQDS